MDESIYNLIPTEYEKPTKNKKLIFIKYYII